VAWRAVGDIGQTWSLDNGSRHRVTFGCMNGLNDAYI